jgi:hypothetical protein
MCKSDISVRYCYHAQVLIYIFICFLSLMYQCKGGKVCVIETLVSVIVIMLKFS